MSGEGGCRSGEMRGGGDLKFGCIPTLILNYELKIIIIHGLTRRYRLTVEININQNHPCAAPH